MGGVDGGVDFGVDFGVGRMGSPGWMVLVASPAKDKSATTNLHLRLTTLFAVFFCSFCLFSPRSSG